jgi:hypothetical protein
MERVHLAGPTQALSLRGSARVAWLARREPRGAHFAVDARFLRYLGGSLTFARSIEPDPSDPYRLGIALIRLGRTARRAIVSFSGHSPAHVHPGDMLLCLFELFPLRARPLGGLCGPSAAGGLPDALTTRVMFRELFTRVSGLAGDAVRTMELILVDGRAVPVRLRDNVYTVEAPTDEFPAKLVAYDGAHRPVAVKIVPTDARPVVRPCPVPNVAPTAGPAPPYDRLNLSTERIDGHVVFGRPLAEIEAAFGPPSATSPSRVTPSMTSLTIGYGIGLAIGFHRSGGIFRAVSLDYRDPRLTIAGVGHALQLPPPELERRIAAAVGSRYRLAAAYGSRPSRLGCSGIFQARAGRVLLIFRLDPATRRPSLFMSR